MSVVSFQLRDETGRPPSGADYDDVVARAVAPFCTVETQEASRFRREWNLVRKLRVFELVGCDEVREVGARGKVGDTPARQRVEHPVVAEVFTGLDALLGGDCAE